MRRKCLALFALLVVPACAPTANLLSAPANVTPASSSDTSSGQKLKLTIFTPGKTLGFLAGAVPWDITLGPAQEIWFTDPNTPAIGRIATDGTVREFRRGLPRGSTPINIVAGPDGNLWFSDSGTGGIGRITPHGAITEFNDATLKRGSTAGIVVGKDNAIWSIEQVFGQYYTVKSSFLVRVSVDGRVSHFHLPDLHPDGSLASSPNGELWFIAYRHGMPLLVERHAEGTLVVHQARLRPGHEQCCANPAPKRMIVGAQGRLWFTTLFLSPDNAKVPANPLATFSDGRVRFYPLFGGALKYPVWPSGVTNDGNDMWVAGGSVFGYLGALFHVKPNGDHEAFPVPYVPFGITANAGTVWFTSYFNANYPTYIVSATPTSMH